MLFNYTEQSSHIDSARLALLFRSSHFRLPGRVSKCGAIVAASLPPAIMVLRILLRYASRERCKNKVRPGWQLVSDLGKQEKI